MNSTRIILGALALLAAVLVSYADACKVIHCETIKDYQGNPQTICSCLDSR